MSKAKTTAFTTGKGGGGGGGQWFRLCNPPATLERLMEQVLDGLPWEVLFI